MKKTPLKYVNKNTNYDIKYISSLLKKLELETSTLQEDLHFISNFIQGGEWSGKNKIKQGV